MEGCAEADFADFFAVDLLRIFVRGGGYLMKRRVDWGYVHRGVWPLRRRRLWRWVSLVWDLKKWFN